VGGGACEFVGGGCVGILEAELDVVEARGDERGEAFRREADARGD